jgi:hypothetical protein
MRTVGSRRRARVPQQAQHPQPDTTAPEPELPRPLPRSRQPQPQQQQQQHPATPQHVPLGECGRVFRCGQATCPPLAALKGNALMDLVIVQDPIGRIETGKSAAVRQRHRVCLRQLQQEFASKRFWRMSLAGAVVTLMRERASARAWKQATLARELANAAGAISDLPLYSNSPVGFRLGESPEFRSATRAAQLLAGEQQVGSQPAAVVDDVRLAVTLAPDVATKVALVLTWLCAGRVNDVLLVKRSELILEPSFASTGAMRVTFCRGKGARFSQPYTVPTTCPLEWRGLLTQYLATFRPTDWLFGGGQPTLGPLVNLALRSANPTFTVRALRLGALQAMSRAGVPLETLTLFSGHKRQDTLLRYLNWGAEAGERSEQARTAALHLMA